MDAEMEHLCPWSALKAPRLSSTASSAVPARELSSQIQTQQSSRCFGARMHEQMKGVTRNNRRATKTLSILKLSRLIEHPTEAAPRGRREP